MRMFHIPYGTVKDKKTGKYFCKHRFSIVKRWYEESSGLFRVIERCRWCDKWIRRETNLKDHNPMALMKTQRFVEVDRPVDRPIVPAKETVALVQPTPNETVVVGGESESKDQSENGDDDGGGDEGEGEGNYPLACESRQNQAQNPDNSDNSESNQNDANSRAIDPNSLSYTPNSNLPKNSPTENVSINQHVNKNVQG